MNRIVLLMETGRAATKEAAKWFAEHGDVVYIGVKAAPKVKLDGAEYLVGTQKGTTGDIYAEGDFGADRVMKYSSGKYDYYTYEGYLIQVAAGLDINNYITFD